MKRIIFLLVAMIALASITFAANDMTEDKGKPEGIMVTANGDIESMQGSNDSMKGSDDSGMKESENKSMNGSKGPVMEVNGTQVHAGLYNALQNVENENARAALQRNMERFLERYNARLDNMTDVEVEVDDESGEMQIKAKEQVKYLGFIKGTATKRFNVENNGKIVENAPWYRFLYAEQN